MRNKTRTEKRARHISVDFNLESHRKCLALFCRSDFGFSLLEIMVAIAILAISFLSLINFEGQSVAVAGKAEKLTLATFLGQQKMGEVMIDLEKEIAGGLFPDDKSEEGAFEAPYENYHWKWAVRKVELPAPAGGESGSPMQMMFSAVAEQIAQAVREVKLTITWNDLGKEKSFDVVTHLTKL